MVCRLRSLIGDVLKLNDKWFRGHYHVHDKPVITQATQLAMALVGNLGLNKPPLKEPKQIMLNLDARGCPTKPFSPSPRTMEERRAVLGCFLLGSVYLNSSPKAYK